jgi:hypothetical protein
VEAVERATGKAWPGQNPSHGATAFRTLGERRNVSKAGKGEGRAETDSPPLARPLQA